MERRRANMLQKLGLKDRLAVATAAPRGPLPARLFVSASLVRYRG